MKREDKEQRLDEEIRHHLEAEARDRQSDGLSPAEARHAAMRDLGNVGLIKEATREVWGWTSLQRLAQDVRYGLRMMRRSPGVSTLAVVSLSPKSADGVDGRSRIRRCLAGRNLSSRAPRYRGGPQSRLTLGIATRLGALGSHTTLGAAIGYQGLHR